MINLLITFALLALVVLAYLIRKRNQQKARDAYWRNRVCEARRWWKEPPEDGPEGDY